MANKVSPMGPGQFVVSFVSQVQGNHLANINFNDEPVNGLYSIKLKYLRAAITN